MIPDVLEESCATRQALERLAAKWRILLIYALLAGPQRHAELRRRLPGITQKVLTETLRNMERDELVERRVLKDTAPQHVEYALTALGKTLQQPLAAICTWALEHPSATLNE
ncbi:helix-turn-helix domain-containing protein [Actinomadura sp. KC216]|uniref:winged helix-turn-helix transcriptional regulator n=1 Tax=Actinomadura sp. KC216 TaxID=2530370 RepID=UPI001FB7269A|nr:helix-turn-helix domain-containing protein [Actinomadura sp. KC216]